MNVVPRPDSFRTGGGAPDADGEPAADEVSGLTLAFVTIRTGLPDADTGRGSACMQPVRTTSIFGLVFDCPATLAAKQRHAIATTPVRLIGTSGQPRPEETGAIGPPMRSAPGEFDGQC